MRLSAKAPIVIRGEEITHLDADGYKHLPRATSLPDGKVLATSGGKWAPSDLSGISVSSVFGRTGAVTAQAGDYTAEQVGAEPYAGTPAQTSFWRSTAAGVRAWVQLVAADITDLAATLAAYLTKADPTFTGALKQGATTRITAGGGAWFASIQSTNLVGAGDRPIAADLTGTLQPKTPDQFRNMISALSASLKGAANGVAELGADGRVPTTQLPSYVDDVVEYATFSAFPDPGETGKIYINLDQNKTWRWSGSAYVEISASLALGETPATAYRGDRGVIAYNHSQLTTGNPHGTTAADVGALAASSPNFTGAMSQSGTERITAGGDGRFESVRGNDLANTDSSAVFADANGNLQKTPHLSLSLVFGPQFGARLGLVSAFYNGTSGYLGTSMRMGPDDVAESNAPLGVESGDFWNSKRYHAIGIADGAVGARYLGRLRADRWTGTSVVSISGTTSATSWFAAGTGAGSPTLPANYLQGGRRVRAKGRVSCQSCAADTAPELSFLIGSTTIKTQAKAFTIASGNVIFVDFDVDFWADGDGYLVAVGDIEFYSPTITGGYKFKINYAGAYDGSSAKTIDATIKPSSSGETWARNMAFVEA